MTWPSLAATDDSQGGQVLTAKHCSLDRMKRREVFGCRRLYNRATTNRVPRQIKYGTFQGRRERTVREWPQIARTELPLPLEGHQEHQAIE